MEEPRNALVEHLRSAGLLADGDVERVLALQRQVRDANGVEISGHEVLGVAQAIGRAVERVAAAAADVAVHQIGELAAEERDAAIDRWLAVVMPVTTETFGLLCDHRAHQIARRRLEVSAREHTASPPLTVAFVDLRGSTRFMLESTPREIEALSDELYATGQRIAARHDVAAGKFLGDGVLLVSADTAPLLEATAEAVTELGERTPLRAGAGVAHGPVTRRAGDWHGPPVNLAARLAELAAADEILVDDGVAASGALQGRPWREVTPRGLGATRRVAVYGDR